MKFKRILSLGIVLGAVLSVGMIVSAMAEEATTEASTEETTLIPPDQYVENIDGGYYELNPTTLGLAKDTAYPDAVVKNFHGIYLDLAKVDADDVRVNNKAKIVFRVKKACKLDVVLDVSNASQESSDGKAKYLIKADGDESYDGTTQYSSTNNPLHTLKPDVTYTIEGANSSGARIDELDFISEATEMPKYDFITPGSVSYSYGKDQGGTENTGCIAVVKNEAGTKYYGILVLNKTTAEANNHIKVYLKSKGKETVDAGTYAETDQVYSRVKLDGGEYEYSSHKFGQDCDYLYAFEITGADENATIESIRNDLAIEFTAPPAA